MTYWGLFSALTIIALCDHLNLSKVDLIGCSGGALVAINAALENPERIDAMVADSFEGIKANASITEQIYIGRNYAKQNEGFCSMLKMMHGDDWECFCFIYVENSAFFIPIIEISIF